MDTLIESVFAGLRLLKVVDINLALILYVVLNLTPLFVIGAVSDKRPIRSAVLFFVATPLLQASSVFVFVGATYPILLGLSTSAYWSAPWSILANYPVWSLKTIGLMIVASIIVGLIPLVGRASSVGPLVSGAIALVAIIKNSPLPTYGIDFFPDLITAIGLVFISAFLGWALFMGVAMAFVKREELMTLIVLPLASVPGVLGILFYGAYVGAQI